MHKQFVGLSSSSIAVLWDWQNVRLSNKQSQAQLTYFLAFINSKRATIRFKNVYADWRYDCNSAMGERFDNAGFDCIHVSCSERKKNQVDHKIIEHGERILMDAMIDTVILISGDKDFCQLVRRLKENGKTVIIMSGYPNNTSLKLSQLADEFHYLNCLNQMEFQLNALPRAS